MIKDVSNWSDEQFETYARKLDRSERARWYTHVSYGWAKLATGKYEILRRMV